MKIHPDNIRRRPTVEHGIMGSESAPPDGRVRIVEYQPDNGTRYLLIFTRVGDMGMRRNIGCGEDAVLVTLATDPANQRSCIFSYGGMVEPSRIQERLTESWVDAMALTEIIGFILEAEVPSLERMVEWAEGISQ